MGWKIAGYKYIQRSWTALEENTIGLQMTAWPACWGKLAWESMFTPVLKNQHWIPSSPAEDKVLFLTFEVLNSLSPGGWTFFQWTYKSAL